MSEDCPFDIIGPAEILEIASWLPSVLVTNLRKTCKKMLKVIPAPQKMGFNLLLRIGAKMDSRDLCKFARAKGAIVFKLMLKDAAYYGNLDLCFLAIEWQNDFLESQGRPKENREFIEKIACGGARGMQKEILDFALEKLKCESASPRFWSRCLGDACLSGNIHWCREVKKLIEPHRTRFYGYYMHLLESAFYDKEICDFVFETLGSIIAQWEFDECFHKLIRKGQVEMCKYWKKIGERLAVPFSLSGAKYVACRFGNSEMITVVDGWGNASYDCREIGHIARMGLFDRCHKQIEHMEKSGLEVNWEEIAGMAVAYPGESEFCDMTIDRALQFHDKNNRDSIVAFLTYTALYSRNESRIKRLISLHSNRDVLFSNIFKFNCSASEKFEYVRAFIGTIFPNLTTEDFPELKHMPILITAGTKKTHKILYENARLLPVYEYCKSIGICPEFCEKFSKMNLAAIGKPDDYTRKSCDVPLQ